MGRHLISIEDLSIRDIRKIFSLTEELKRSPESFQNALRGHKFALIFEKPSTRTWVSFETGIFQLGGGSIYLGPGDIKLGVREETRDVARVLDRYLSGVVMRTFVHQTIAEFEKYFTKPVINGLSDKEHPCQALADYFTLHEHCGNVAKPVMAYVGDGNNVLSSLLLLAARLGATLRYATPKGLGPDKDILQTALNTASSTGAQLEGTHKPEDAVENADAVYADVWVSMGEEKIRAKKLKQFKGFQLNAKLMAGAKKKAIVMHCLPAHRGEEITEEIMESKNSVVFDQAENRLHVQKAVLLFLMGS